MLHYELSTHYGETTSQSCILDLVQQRPSCDRWKLEVNHKPTIDTFPGYKKKL